MLKNLRLTFYINTITIFYPFTAKISKQTTQKHQSVDKEGGKKVNPAIAIKQTPKTIAFIPIPLFITSIAIFFVSDINSIPLRKYKSG